MRKKSKTSWHLLTESGTFSLAHFRSQMSELEIRSEIQFLCLLSHNFFKFATFYLLKFANLQARMAINLFGEDAAAVAEAHRLRDLRERFNSLDHDIARRLALIAAQREEMLARNGAAVADADPPRGDQGLVREGADANSEADPYEDELELESDSEEEEEDDDEERREKREEIRKLREENEQRCDIYDVWIRFQYVSRSFTTF